MKPFIIISLLFHSVGFSQLTARQYAENIRKNREYNANDLIEMDNGLWTEKFSDIPVTGKVFVYYGEKSNPKKVHTGNLLNGKKEGKWVRYHSTGRKSYEGNWKDGKEDGLMTSWYEDGSKKYEGSYKNGKEDGLHTHWHERRYQWDENGHKWHEGTYKDGKKDGLWNNWYSNGKKVFEGTYKDGEVLSSKKWNKDGSVKE